VLSKTWDWLDLQLNIIQDRIANERTWQLNVAQVPTLLQSKDGHEYIKSMYESLYPDNDYIRGESAAAMNEAARDAGIVRTKQVSSAPQNG
jgi:hypothetical protein